MDKDKNHMAIWGMVLDKLRISLSGTDVVDEWFSKYEIALLSEKIAVIAVPTLNNRMISESIYKKTIEAALKDVVGIPLDVYFRVFDSKPYDLSEFFFTRDINDPDDAPSPLSEKPRKPLPKPDIYGSGELSPHRETHGEEYTFENFIVGNSNKFAHAACTAVASKPATEYNPLFIHGPSGLGKTHLLYAIINRVMADNPNFNYIYVNGEDFTNQMIDSLSRNKPAEFRAKYRKADMLLIDDIHFIAGREATQEEFFHTFNALYNEKKQIIMTSDRPPKDIKTLEDRLKTRFEWGLIADIQPPDLELRIAIMKNKAQALNLTIPNDILIYLAENIKNNIRQIEGAVKKICAKCLLSGVPVSMSLAQSCISDIIEASGSLTVTPEKIIERVARKYNVTSSDLLGKKRTKDIAWARHIAIYLVREINGFSYKYIGDVIFGRDHSTIMSSIDVINKEIKMNPIFESEINDLIRDIKG